MIRIIIVEDDPMVAQLNAACVGRMEGFEVRGIFANGREALKFLRENPVELAIVDVYMPVFSGLELLRSMRFEGIQTSVIMITAAMETPVVQEALRLGIEDYIIKPFSYERLRESVNRFRDKNTLVHSSRTVSQAVVDRLLGNPRTLEQLPKGLNARTLASVRGCLDRDPEGDHTCESISAATGLSKVTVRHYLNYLIELGTLTSAIDYETGGRPRVLYRCK